jgi:PAS domain S-box-containing protein
MDNRTPSESAVIVSLEKRVAELEAKETQILGENTLLRQMYEKESLSFQSLDAKGCFLSVNQTWLDTIGYSREEVIGQKFSDFLHPDWRVNFDRNFPRLNAIGEVLGAEFQMQKKDGSFILVSLNGKIVQDSHGKFKKTFCVFQDITHKKYLEDALAISEKKWRNIIVSMPQIGGSMDCRGRIVFINKHFSKLVGWEEHEVIGQDWFDMFIPPDVREERRQRYLHSMKQNDVSEYSTIEMEILTRTGEVKNVCFSNVMSKDPSGNITEMTSLGVDLTELRQAAETLLQSQKLTERIINTIPERVFWKDVSLVYMGCNTTFARDAGFDDPKDIIGKDDYELMPEQAELYRKDDFEVLRTGQPKLFIEEPQTTKQGDTIYLLTSKAPLRNSKGEISGVVGTYIDITKRKQMEAENERLQGQLGQAQKLEAIGQLAAGIAHEINTPSQYLVSNTSFLSDSFREIDDFLSQYDLLFQSEVERLGLGEKVSREFAALKEQFDWEYLKEEIPKSIIQSQDGLAKIRSIVQAMKEFSHPGGKDKQSTNVNRLLETILTISSSEWKYVAEIKKELEIELPQVSCLSDELGQVFLNILVNAAHGIAEKIGDNPEDTKGSIIITSRSLKDKIEITFTDSGAGIPADIRHKVFDPFFTTKEVGRGTGQGLAIAYDIVVNKHGGAINCSSVEGEGTTISIVLPQ